MITEIGNLSLLLSLSVLAVTQSVVCILYSLLSLLGCTVRDGNGWEFLEGNADGSYPA